MQEPEVLRLALDVTMGTEGEIIVGHHRVKEDAPEVTAGTGPVAGIETGPTRGAAVRRVLEGAQRYDAPHSFAKSRVFLREIPTTGFD